MQLKTREWMGLLVATIVGAAVCFSLLWDVARNFIGPPSDVKRADEVMGKIAERMKETEELAK